MTGTPRYSDSSWIDSSRSSRLTGSEGEGGFEFPRNWRQRIWTPGIKDTAFEVMDRTPHDLRHTAASLAIASGADVKVVQDTLGHQSAAMTLDIYAGLFPDRQDEVTTRMGAMRQRALDARLERAA